MTTEYNFIRHMLIGCVSYARYYIFRNKFNCNDTYFCHYSLSEYSLNERCAHIFKNIIDLSQDNYIDVMAKSMNCAYELELKKEKNIILFIFDEDNKIDDYLKEDNQFKQLITDNYLITIIYVSKHINKNYDNYFELRDSDNYIENEDFHIYYKY